MRLSEFITSRTDEIVQEWERFARTCLPAAKEMKPERLRNHAADLLQFIAHDMETAQSPAQQASKSWGPAARSADDTEAEKHAVLRVADGFTLEHVVGEFRALRSSVLNSSLPLGRPGEEVTRFNECIDQLLSESVARHAKLVAEHFRRENHQKDELISMLSHELRNPIGAIRAAVQVLNAQGSSDSATAPIVDILIRQTRHLARPLDDIQDVARISRRRVVLKIGSVDLRTCVRDAMDGNRQILADKEHAVSIDMPKAPVIAEVDCTRVAQVLGNLVNNAAKLSPTSHATQVNIDPTPR